MHRPHDSFYYGSADRSAIGSLSIVTGKLPVTKSRKPCSQSRGHFRPYELVRFHDCESCQVLQVRFARGELPGVTGTCTAVHVHSVVKSITTHDLASFRNPLGTRYRSPNIKRRVTGHDTNSSGVMILTKGGGGSGNASCNMSDYEPQFLYDTRDKDIRNLTWI